MTRSKPENAAYSADERASSRPLYDPRRTIRCERCRHLAHPSIADPLFCLACVQKHEHPHEPSPQPVVDVVPPDDPTLCLCWRCGAGVKRGHEFCVNPGCRVFLNGKAVPSPADIAEAVERIKAGAVKFVNGRTIHVPLEHTARVSRRGNGIRAV